VTDPANPGIAFADAQRTYEAIKQDRVKAREEYRAALRKRANKAHDVTKGMALAFAKHRSEGKPVEESKILAKADVAGLQLEHDLADSEARSALARIEELEAGRATLRQLADWTREET
jgi:hypothetical protein